MSDILLAKPNLPPDWIDVSVGEAHVVKEKLMEVFDLSVYELPKIKGIFDYPSPCGYGPLVKLLEDKYKHPVIITNGAKQALGASFYALKQMGKTSIGMRSIYWALIPPLVRMHGLEPIVKDEEEFDSYLCVAPNNPDGHMPDIKVLELDAFTLKTLGIPFIHDAAYYTHTYLPSNYDLKAFGDIQIYSFSKMLGLSGLRAGFVVCPNKEFYRHIQQYMEAMTVGVSILSQIFLYDLLNRMSGYPSLTERFEGLSSNALIEAKKIVKGIDSSVLEVPSDIETIPGMFGFFKKGPKLNLNKSKVNMIDGEHFGAPGYVRMNLAFCKDKMTEIVKRLNGAVL